MEKLFIATGNAHKITEFKEIFKTLGLEFDVVCPKDFNDDSEPNENGNSYAENSYIKAKYYYDKYKIPTIADDSGIEIDFYDGKPGIYSARFLPELNYKDKNNHILNEMRGSDNRGASFHCLATYIKDDVAKSYEGILYGHIADIQDGSKGFGYDPIFVAEGQTETNAVLGEEFKNKYSHRAIALGKWAKDLENK
ncbi:MAG: RdgB/HAM1 family non-canonical purine NTP pyrophosphatase [Erysipelotrichaceae bacterium]|nr:RdgB/HAM1 family non-canonical purine NTP pyrophosphatase [Erysipelotrichaceae bacterium]